MPTLAGWLTGEQVSREIIDQTLTTMGDALNQHGGYTGQPARAIQPGAGLIAFSNTAHTMVRNDEPPLLDWVPDRRTMVYRRPLSGAHVLYYIENWPAQGNLLFASEIKALLAVGVPRKIHLAALDALLRYGFIPAPWTAFQDISIVPAGSILRWQRAKTVMNPSTDYTLDKTISSAGAVEKLATLLDNATAGLLPPHEQLVALTNGNQASALSTLLTTQHTQAPFTIASLGYTKNTTTKHWQRAEQIAAVSQRPFLAITGVDQPEFWIATLMGSETPVVDTRALAMHQLLHTASAETNANVAMSGLGASVLFASATSTIDEQAFAQAKQQDILQWYSQTVPTARKTETTLWSQDVLQQLKREESWERTHHAQKLLRQASRFKEKKQGWYYLDLHLRLPDLVVSAAQQLSTQEQLALRSPYLHADVLDTLTRLPLTLHDGKPKETLLAQLVYKHGMYGTQAALARVPTLPLQIQADSLLHVEQSELLHQTLSTDAIRATGIFAVQAVEALLKQEQVSRELVLVFTTQLLCRLFGVGM